MANRSLLSILSLSEIRRDAQRFSYYARGMRTLMTPRGLLARRHRARLEALETHPQRDEIERRVAYYLKGTEPFEQPQMRLGDLPLKKSRYYIDFTRYARGLPTDARFDLIFGDVTHIPDRPTLVKSRPIHGENANSILFPLNILRHYYDYPDPYSYAEKQDGAVWRGNMNNPQRRALVQRHNAAPHHDIGVIKANEQGLEPKPYLSPEDQLKYKFILSIEGVDVATNLKWTMASNSLVLSPPLKFETWYREGQLVPGVHFVELKPDFSDLDEKCAYYSQNPEAALKIITAAQAWRNSFRDQEVEALTATCLLDRYLGLSGQNFA